uniref:21 kDa extracellular calmodulin-binding protein n=1 Tax=Angelica dahurica TaxID=48101 RepID=Q94CJ4_9APIA|nr:21 kDa extracellular calmodulin-binding protein [Angelica dahurica]
MKFASAVLVPMYLCLVWLFFHQTMAVDPTVGFTSLPLDQSNLDIQRPYNVPVSKRYSFVNGVHKMWVYKTDKPHSPDSHTNPRTEIRIRGYDFSSGVWQFEADGYVPEVTSGASIMQIFGGSPHATTLMLWTYKGTLSYYRNPVLVNNIYGRWFRLNVIYDVDANKVQVYIDGDLKFGTAGRGGESFFFKCGVYAQDGASDYMESRWKNIKVLKKN